LGKDGLNITNYHCVSVHLIIQESKNHVTHYVYNVASLLPGDAKRSALSPHMYQFQKILFKYKIPVLKS